MVRPLLIAAGFACILAIAARAAPPPGAYLDGGASTVGVILVHGRHAGRGEADSDVVGPLRHALHDRLGVHTFSIEFPQTAGSANAEDEVANFPAAYGQISQAVDFLIHEKDVTRIYLVGHSLGARITLAYLATHPSPAVKGYVGVGVLGPGCNGSVFDPLATACNLRTVLRDRPGFPVLDVVATGSERDVRFAQGRSRISAPGYRQTLVEGADHNFRRGGAEMLSAVSDWLKAQTGR